MKYRMISILCAVSAAAVCACSGGEIEPIEENRPPEPERSVTRLVGISMPNRAQERWERDAGLLEENFRNGGFDVKVEYSSDDPAIQSESLRSMIDEGAVMLVISAVDMDSLSEVLDIADEKDIPVVAYDRFLMGSDAVDYYVSYDNEEVGRLQAQCIVDKLGLEDAEDRHFTLEIFSGDISDLNAESVYKGAMSVLDNYIDSGVLQIPSGRRSPEDTMIKNWDADTARNSLQGILSAYYEGKDAPDAVLCPNDTVASGAVAALENTYGSFDTIVTGQDADEGNLAMIKDGRQTMTVYKSSRNEAAAAYELCISVLNGQRPDEKLIEAADWDFECCYNGEGYDNGKKNVPAFLLRPVSINRDNIESELVEKGHAEMDDSGNVRTVE